jgi:predicted site-specific integrase-resolvase
MPRKARIAPDTRKWNLSPAVVGKQVGLSPETIRRYMRKGDIDHIKLGEYGHLRTCQEAVDDFVAQMIKEAG